MGRGVVFKELEKLDVKEIPRWVGTYVRSTLKELLDGSAYRGRRGRRGARGDAGDGGATGKDGAEGANGPRGEVGAVGLPGSDGDDGEVGKTGERGVGGLTGKRGEHGTPGAKGDKGDKGDQGEVGPRPAHKWEGTRLSFEKPNGQFGRSVNLQGPGGGRGPSGSGGGKSANPGFSSIALVGTDLIFARDTAGPLGPDITVDLSSLVGQGGFVGLGPWRSRTEIVAPPGSGQLRFNNADPELATELFLHETNENGEDLANFIALIEDGDLVYIQVASDSSQFILCEVSTNTDNGTYVTLGLANVSQQGAAIAQNTTVNVIATIAGGGGASSLGGLTDVTLTAPAEGDHLVKTATDWVNRQPNVQREFFEQLSNYAIVSSDFFEPPGGLQVDGLQAVAAGVGAAAGTPSAAYDFTNHPGVWGLNTGSTSAGRVFLLSQFAQGFNVGVGGLTRFGAYYQVGAFLSDVTNRYVLRAGFSSMALPNTILQGITFEYQDNQNGGRWQGVCEDGIGETSLDTGVLAVASTYYFLEFEVNAAGTSVEFFIDKVSVGTVVTNIPSGTGFGHFVSIHIMKLIGVTNRAPYVDAYYLYQEVTR